MESASALATVKDSNENQKPSQNRQGPQNKAGLRNRHSQGGPKERGQPDVMWAPGAEKDSREKLLKSA